MSDSKMLIATAPCGCLRFAAALDTEWMRPEQRKIHQRDVNDGIRESVKAGCDIKTVTDLKEIPTECDECKGR